MSNGKNRKELNFELDLLPVISMMSVCVCFLLLTAVWTHLGSVNVEQGLGQESTRSEEQQKSASLWITMKAGGQIQLKMMDSPQVPSILREKNFVIGSAGSGWVQLERHATEIKRALPELKTALIMPDAGVNYGDVIRMMDRLKGMKISEVGLAPL